MAGCLPTTNMHHIQYQIQVEGVNQDVRDWLIAILVEAGMEAFEEQENLLIAAVPQAQADEEAIEEILLENNLDFTKHRIAPQNWNAQWEQSFEPVTVGHFAAVRAHFHAPVAGVQHQVIITPKMSFGTGHHATTYMMLQAMESLDFQQKRVVDFGTGTGVLAVLAQKLGAAHVLGIDNDAWSIENATENRTLNKAGGVQLLQADTFTAPWPADIILANINRNVLLEQAPALVAGLAANGTLVLSGILQQDETDIKNCFEQRGLQTFKQLERNNWLAIIFKKMTP